jgi:hypothetical protein
MWYPDSVVNGVPLVFSAGLTQDSVASPVAGALAAVTVTVALWEAEPPAPLQVRVYLVVAVRPGVGSEPRVPSLPLQPPDAVQEVALLDDQLRVDFPPLPTEVGLAVKLATGGVGVLPVTATVADFEALPPAPEQVSVKVAFFNMSVAVFEPLTA